MPVRSYHLPEISCGGCRDSIRAAVGGVPGVDEIEVDLEERRVTVTGDAPDEVVRAAIENAGYDIAGAVSV